LSVNFILNTNGVSASNLVQWNISNNVGTMIIRGETYNTIAYYTQVMGIPPEVRWFDLFGISEKGNNLAIVYLGCNPPPTTNVIQSIWEEDFDNQLESDFPNDTIACDFNDLSNKPDFTFKVDFPALNGLPPASVDTGIQIRGKEVYLNGDYGWMLIQQSNYSIVPISTVDCSDCGENCDTCPQSPWYELHFIYYSVELQQKGFGIFYIYPYNQSFVQLNYTLCLPTLATPAITYDAIWTGNIPIGKHVMFPFSSDTNDLSIPIGSIKQRIFGKQQKLQRPSHWNK